MTSPDKPQCPTCGGLGHLYPNAERGKTVPACPDCHGTGVQTPKTPDESEVSSSSIQSTEVATTSITPPTSFAAEVRVALQKHRRDATREGGVVWTEDEALAAITAAHERDMEQFVERLKQRGMSGDAGWDLTPDDIDAEQRARIKGEA